MATPENPTDPKASAEVAGFFDQTPYLPQAYAKQRVTAIQDPRTTDELIATAISEDDTARAAEALSVLKWRGSRDVLEAARKLCGSARASQRQLGVEILGELGLPPTFPDECVEILLDLLAGEEDTDVLAAIGFAFENLHDPRGIEPLARFRDHPSTDVRYAVVHGISGHEDALAIRTLIEMSEDREASVRDWATFGLAQRITTDTPTIRHALLRRCLDRDDDTRAEAIMGLVRRGDESAPDYLLRELRRPIVGLLTLEAAAELSDARLYEPLVRLREVWKGSWNEDEIVLKNTLLAAIVSCKPRE